MKSVEYPQDFKIYSRTENEKRRKKSDLLQTAIYCVAARDEQCDYGNTKQASKNYQTTMLWRATYSKKKKSVRGTRSRKNVSGKVYTKWGQYGNKKSVGKNILENFLSGYHGKRLIQN